MLNTFIFTVNPVPAHPMMVGLEDVLLVNCHPTVQALTLK